MTRFLTWAKSRFRAASRFHGPNGDLHAPKSARVWSRDDLAGYIDTASRQRVRLTADQLIRAYREGRLEDPGDVADLLVLVGALPKDDPLLVRPG